MFHILIQGSKFQIPNFGYHIPVPGSNFQIPGFNPQAPVPSCKFQAQQSRFQVLGSYATDFSFKFYVPQIDSNLCHDLSTGSHNHCSTFHFQVPSSSSKFQIPNSRFQFINSTIRVKVSKFLVSYSRFQAPASRIKYLGSTFRISKHNSRIHIPVKNANFQVPDSWFQF